MKCGRDSVSAVCTFLVRSTRGSRTLNGRRPGVIDVCGLAGSQAKKHALGGAGVTHELSRASDDWQLSR